MGRSADYDKHYAKGPDHCGKPFAEFASFFEHYETPEALVLDLGCGQGRDSLLAARYGHQVVGVDLSGVGVRQMLAVARRERLHVEGVVADLVKFKSRRKFDMVILDRVLHCVPSNDDRRAVLEQACRWTRKRGHILIADMPKNRTLIRAFFEAGEEHWAAHKRNGNFLFMRRIA